MTLPGDREGKDGWKDAMKSKQVKRGAKGVKPSTWLIIGAAAAGFAGLTYLAVDPALFGGTSVKVTVPQLSPLAARGGTAFESNCAACHGPNGSGTDQGPPLIHSYYNPGHHADGAFVAAVRNGVPQHHWQFGDMPPQPQVSNSDLAAIIRFIREVQLANGIRYEPHNM